MTEVEEWTPPEVAKQSSGWIPPEAQKKSPDQNGNAPVLPPPPTSSEQPQDTQQPSQTNLQERPSESISRAQQSIERRRQLLEQGVSDIIVKEPIYQVPKNKETLLGKIQGRLDKIKANRDKYEPEQDSHLKQYVEGNIQNIGEAGIEAANAPPMTRGFTFFRRSLEQAKEGKPNIVGAIMNFTDESVKATAENAKELQRREGKALADWKNNAGAKKHLENLRDISLGTVKTAISGIVAAGSVTPAGIGFAAVVDGINGATGSPELTEKVMTAATTAGKKYFGLDENSPTWEQDLYHIADFGAMVLGMKAMHIAGKKMSELKKEDFRKAAEEMTPNDVAATATHPENIELAKKEKTILDTKDDIEKVPDEAKPILQAELQKAEAEKQQIEQAEVQSQIDEAHRQTQEQVKSEIEKAAENPELSETSKAALTQTAEQIKVPELPKIDEEIKQKADISTEEKGIDIGEEMRGNKFPNENEIYDILESEEGRQGGTWIGGEDAKFENEQKAKDYAKEVHDILSSVASENEIPIYRVVKAEEVDLDPYGIGESWSFDKDAAIQFGKQNLGGKNIKLISARVPKENVDWKQAVRQHHNFSSDFTSIDAEFELPISAGSKLLDVKVSDIKKTKPVKPENVQETLKPKEENFIVEQNKDTPLGKSFSIINKETGQSSSIVFSTKEEAQAHADKLNSKLHQEEVKPSAEKETDYKVGITTATERLPIIQEKINQINSLEAEGKFEEANKIHDEILDEGEKLLQDVFSDLPEVKVNINRSKSNFFGSSEPTFVVDIKADAKHLFEIQKRVSNLAESWKQKSVHVSEVLPKLKRGEKFGKQNADGSIYEPNIDIFFDRELTDKELSELNKALQEQFAGATFHPDKKGINLYNVTKYGTAKEFIAKLPTLEPIIQKFTKDRGGVAGRTVRSVRKLWNIGEPADGSIPYEQFRDKVSGKEQVTKPLSEEKPPKKSGGTSIEEKKSDELLEEGQKVSKEEISKAIPSEPITISEKDKVKFGSTKRGVIEKTQRISLRPDMQVRKDLETALETLVNEPNAKNYDTYYNAFVKAYESPFRGSEQVKLLWDKIADTFPDAGIKKTGVDLTIKERKEGQIRSERNRLEDEKREIEDKVKSNEISESDAEAKITEINKRLFEIKERSGTELIQEGLNELTQAISGSIDVRKQQAKRLGAIKDPLKEAEERVEADKKVFGAIGKIAEGMLKTGQATAKDIWEKLIRYLKGQNVNVVALEKYKTEIVKFAEEYERKGFLETVKNSPKSSKELVEKATELDEFYKVISNKEALYKADKEIQKLGISDAKEIVMSDTPPSAEKSVMAIRLIKHFEKSGDFDSMIEVLSAYDNQLRESGRFIQAATLWNRLEPTTIVRAAKKMTGKYNKELSSEAQKKIVEMMKKVQEMPDGDAKQKATMEVLNYIAEQLPHSLRELFDAYRYQNMLSNPRSHERNIYGNSFNVFLTEPMVLATKAGYDMFRDLNNQIARDVKFSDIPKYYKDAFNIIPEAFRAAVETYKHGYVADKILDLPKAENMIEAVRKTKLPKSLTVAMRFLEAQDRFFSILISQGEKMRLMRQGVAEGKANEQAIKLAQEYLYREKIDASDKTRLYSVRALDALGEMINKARKTPIIGEPISWFVPFVTTPINIAKMGVKFSPVAALEMGIGTTMGKRYTKNQVAQATLGAVITGVGATMAMQGLTTWAAPKDDEEKKLFYASGRKPYSVKIGDTWIPMAYFGAFGLAFALPAAVKHYQEDSKTALTDNQVQAVGRAIMSTAGFIASQTPLEGLEKSAQAFTGEWDKDAERAAGQITTQAIPLSGMVRYINTILDPVYRKPEGYIENVEAMIPELSKDLKPIKTLQGTDATREPINYVLPFDIGFDEDVYDAMLKNRRNVLQQKEFMNQSKKEGGKLPSLGGKLKSLPKL